MVEIDFGFHTETVLIWPQFAIGAVFAHRYRFEDLDKAAWERAGGQAGLVDRIDESRGAAVHDRHFWSVNFDDHVVDVEAPERGQQMLCGRTQRTLGIAEHGSEFGCGDRADISANFTGD